MPEFRQDYLSGERVCIAIERENRPHNFKKKNNDDDKFKSTDKCPFCEENSHMTPELVFISEDKHVKIIPNKYPVVTEDSADAFGKHEVLIDTPNHEEKMLFLSDLDLFTVMKSIKKRVQILSKIEKIKYVQIFKNDGERAGASIYHSHWQLVALSIIPTKQENINNNFKKYKNEKGTCYLCDEIKKIEKYIVTENENFVAFVPYACIYSYSVTITCKKHFSDIQQFDDEMLKDLAKILKKVLNSLSNTIVDLNYNICVQNKLYFGEDTDINHFYLQIIPRTANIAGFEFSTGVLH